MRCFVPGGVKAGGQEKPRGKIPGGRLAEYNKGGDNTGVHCDNTGDLSDDLCRGIEFNRLASVHYLFLRYVKKRAFVFGCQVITSPKIRFRVGFYDRFKIDHVSIRGSGENPFFHG